MGLEGEQASISQQLLVALFDVPARVARGLYVVPNITEKIEVLEAKALDLGVCK